MANDKDTGMSGRDLQQSQSGGGSGEFGGNMNQAQAEPVGGGTTASDRSNAGGSSGTGGYGQSQNVTMQREGQPAQGSQSGLAGGDLSEGGRSEDSSEIGRAPSGQSRGERFDEEQGGGRGVMFDGSSSVSEFADDQAEHQDRGQSEAEEFEREETQR
ncbi:hypothetical protein [Sphingomonas parva]|uniref:hypothetical protein n=1 Tax=Sphingomonas parva TaxID=2555898 RepID=UPI00142F4483|nr:hypothetical protein [Sphingomonas parva]